MAQQIINTGTEPNDGTGEPLRSAFNAVNENFNEIYAAGPVGSNVVISANVISVTGTNNNLVLSGNGIGEVRLNSSLTPSINAIFDIGSQTSQFREIHTNGVYAAGYFYANGLPFVGGGTGNVGNTISNGDSNVLIATQDGNVTISVNGTPNVAVFQKRNVSFTSNLLPSVNSAYDIGNDSLRFRDLYLSGETIYLGDAEFAANSTAVTITNPDGGKFVLRGTGESGPYSNAIVSTFLPNYTGNLRSLGGDVRTTANIRASNITANNVVSTRDLTLTGNIIGNPGVTTLSNVNVNITTATISTLTITGSVQGTGSLSLTGNVQGGNIVTTGVIQTTSNVVAGNVNVTNTVTSNAISANTINSGSLTTIGNVTANYFIGNGSQLTGLPDAYSNTNVISFLATYDGNISAGALLSENLIASNILTLSVDGTSLRVINDNGAPVILPPANSSLFIRTQSSSTYQLEFDTDGSLTVPTGVYVPLVSTIDLVTNTIRSDDSTPVLVDGQLSVDGVIQTSSSISAAGNIIASNFIGNGSQLTGITASDIGVIPTLTVTGNITSGNINNQGSILTNNLSAAGNIVATAPGSRIDGFVIGQVDAEDANFDNANVLGNLSVSGLTTAANVTSSGSLSAFGTVFAASAGILGNIVSGSIQTTEITGTDISATSLTVTNGISATGNITGSFIIGNGSLLTGVVSTYNDGDVADFLPTYTGNLDSMQGNIVTTANVLANNISVSNLISASTLTTTGDALIGGNLVVNGNTVQINVEELNVEDPIVGIGRGANNTPLTTGDGKSRGVQLWYYTNNEQQAFVGLDTANSVLIAATNVSVTNDVVTVNNYGTLFTGNINSKNIVVDGNVFVSSNVLISDNGNISGINVASINQLAANVVTAGDINAANISANTGASFAAVTVTGNVNATAFNGSAAGLTFIPAGNIVGTVALAESAVVAQTVTASNQSNITAVGTLTSLTVAGNLTVDTNTLIVRDDTNSVGVGGTPLTKFTVFDDSESVGGSQNPASFYSSNIAELESSVILVGRDTNNRAGIGYFYAGENNTNNSVLLGLNGVVSLRIDSANVATFAGDITTGTILIDRDAASISGLAEISSGIMSAAGNVTAGNFATQGQISATGNIEGNNLSVVNSIQSDSIFVTQTLTAGNLQALNTVQSNTISASLINSLGNITAVGNVVAANFVGNLIGSFDAPGATTQILFNDNGVIAASSGLVYDFINNELTVDGNISTNSGGNLNVNGSIDVIGNITVSVGNINGSNINGTRLNVSGNITGGNVSVIGNISAQGNVLGSTIASTGIVSATGNIVSAQNINGVNFVSTGSITTAGSLTAAETVTGGNVISGGRIEATGNIIGGNIATAGNIAVSSVAAQGIISAVGNIVSSEFFIGNFLGNITGNISAAGSNTQLLLNNDGIIGPAVGLTYNSDINVLAVTGNVTATGNIIGTNLITSADAEISGNITTNNITGSTLSLTGNVTSAINTVNDITTTGNISANNITAATSINISGNQVATVDDATALAIALG